MNKWPSLGFRKGSHNDKLYKRLQVAPVRNYEIIREIGLNHTRRISDIRAKLRNFGMDVLALELGNGVWQYQLI